MRDHLGFLSPELPVLFDRAWFSNNSDECPSPCEWEKVLQGISNSSVVKQQEDSNSQKNNLKPSINSKGESPVSVLSKKTKISLSFPKRLSKRFASSFLLQVYFDGTRSKVLKNARTEFGNEGFYETKSESSVRAHQKINISVINPAFTFSVPPPKLIDNPVNIIKFSGTPNDNCDPGHHKILITISDLDTGLEIETLSVTVQVVDFAFDHISRPLISRIMAVILALGSVAMFMLTFLEQVDKTFGFTSGTAAGVLAAATYTSFYALYQRVRPNVS
jgi:hypothetical protein